MKSLEIIIEFDAPSWRLSYLLFSIYGNLRLLAVASHMTATSSKLDSTISWPAQRPGRNSWWVNVQIVFLITLMVADRT